MKAHVKFFIAIVLTLVTSQFVYARPNNIPSQICLGNKTTFNQQSKSKFIGEVKTLVTILPNGKVKEVRILQSSNDKALDNLITKTAYQVHYPYTLKDIVELRIIRTWQFKNGKLVNDVC